MRRVVLVTGAPCSGKTSYVADHARPGDLVLDQDVIGAAAMNRGLAKVTQMTAGTAWVIRCCAGPGQRAELATRIRADQVVHLDVEESVLLARARTRRNPAAQVRAVRYWLALEQGDGAGDDPAPRARTAW